MKLERLIKKIRELLIGRYTESIRILATLVLDGQILEGSMTKINGVQVTAKGLLQRVLDVAQKKTEGSLNDLNDLCQKFITRKLCN